MPSTYLDSRTQKQRIHERLIRSLPVGAKVIVDSATRLGMVYNLIETCGRHDLKAVVSDGDGSACRLSIYLKGFDGAAVAWGSLSAAKIKAIRVHNVVRGYGNSEQPQGGYISHFSRWLKKNGLGQREFCRHWCPGVSQSAISRALKRGSCSVKMRQRIHEGMVAYENRPPVTIIKGRNSLTIAMGIEDDQPRGHMANSEMVALDQKRREQEARAFAKKQAEAIERRRNCGIVGTTPAEHRRNAFYFLAGMIAAQAIVWLFMP